LTLQVKDSPVKHVLPSTGMAAHAMDDPIEAIELEDRHEPMDAALENIADDETRSPVMSPCPPPMVNACKQVIKLASARTHQIFAHATAWNCASASSLFLSRNMLNIMLTVFFCQYEGDDAE
jgi:hypothetical protein